MGDILVYYNSLIKEWQKVLDLGLDIGYLISSYTQGLVNFIGIICPYFSFILFNIFVEPCY